MRVLIACESSGVVREAFAALGHDAWSCDLLPSEIPGAHYQGDVRDILDGWIPVPSTTLNGIEYKEINGILFGRSKDNPHWDLMIAHPDCTYLTCSAEWAYGDAPYHQRVKPETLVGAARRAARIEALNFVRLLMRAPISKIAIENPIGAINRAIRPPDCYIQPYEYGHDASKKTGLWLKNLPPLQPTKFIKPRIVDGKNRWGNQCDSGQNKLTPASDRWKERARTYQGWADAMAKQWGS